MELKNLLDKETGVNNVPWNSKALVSCFLLLLPYLHFTSLLYLFLPYPLPLFFFSCSSFFLLFASPILLFFSFFSVTAFLKSFFLLFLLFYFSLSFLYDSLFLCFPFFPFFPCFSSLIFQSFPKFIHVWRNTQMHEMHSWKEICSIFSRGWGTKYQTFCPHPPSSFLFVI